jgi:hypothetical protein
MAALNVFYCAKETRGSGGGSLPSQTLSQEFEKINFFLIGKNFG